MKTDLQVGDKVRSSILEETGTVVAIIPEANDWHRAVILLDKSRLILTRSLRGAQGILDPNPWVKLPTVHKIKKYVVGYHSPAVKRTSIYSFDTEEEMERTIRMYPSFSWSKPQIVEFEVEEAVK